MGFTFRVTAAVFAFVFIAIVFTTFEHPPVQIEQRGYRGLGMIELNNPRNLASTLAANAIPDPIPPEQPSGQRASEVYSNVQVLKDVDAAEFLRLMNSITEWVAPEQGCSYCHADGKDLSEDALYTKIVARRMLQMTQQINTNWKTHVAGTGVTCYTCHRGQPVPAFVWFDDPGPAHAHGFAQEWIGQNHPTEAVGSTSLPADPFASFLGTDSEIRVVSTTALPTEDRHTIKDAESTYGLMIHFSKALGVNCTYCHNTRSFFSWDLSTPQRATAWYGIRMVRDLNTNFLGPLQAHFPENRLGPLGDGPKLNCETCHQGAYKPLLGTSMLPGYPELGAAQ